MLKVEFEEYKEKIPKDIQDDKLHEGDAGKFVETKKEGEAFSSLFISMSTTASTSKKFVPNQKAEFLMNLRKFKKELDDKGSALSGLVNKKDLTKMWLAKERAIAEDQAPKLIELSDKIKETVLDYLNNTVLPDMVSNGLLNTDEQKLYFKRELRKCSPLLKLVEE